MAHRVRVAQTITALGAALALIVAVLTLTTSAFAVEPDEIMADPALEARAREISKGLRCVVCQNQSIDDSNAELARDLRVLVRERLRQGDSDSEVVAYVVSRYGDFVLLKPPFKAATYALWIGPAVILAVGVLAVVLFYRRRRAAVADALPPLTPAEQRRVDALLARKQP